MYKTATGTEPQANVQWLPDELQQIAVIGVHGWFPMKTIQRVFGEPTGTSPKFCEQMEKAIQEFVKSHYQYSIPPECLTCMPLEGEGRIEHRVDRLFQQLIDPTCSAPPVDSNIIYPSEKSYWQHKLETAKTVFIATHSQGTPVSILLLSKLLTLGLVDPKKQKICVLAQAGISHGPFPYLKTNFIVKYFEADAARELFEFNDCNSSIAQLYHSAIQKILQAGVKVVLLSSWLDQVVPLYSSAFCGISHPNIYRAVFIDNENFYPQDFLPHLVIFALKLRNYGLSDYDLLVHLSDVVAGSIYTGTQGHSTLYDEVAVYTLAINFLLGSPHDPSSDLMLSSTSQFSSSTKLNLPWSLFLRHSTSNSKHPHHHVHSVKVNEFNAPVRLNPYHLPWIMHHIISDNEIKNHPVLSRDLEYLLEMFSKWDVGNSKVRKELKYRLDAIRNVLGNSKL
ncbi:hypothetical protein BKA69DRAFT_1028899 [Paraphysoderma sedebokerense]|nr:hypothetical protein BKA69DRAFT_1028899 [Paraphysoderma sedebokerense]